MPRHRISSSARAFHCLLTWAARQREVASRYPRTLSEISLGKTVKQSIRMSCASCSVSKESWEKQHMVSKPWRIRARRGWEDEEKLDHIALTASRSWTGSASRDCEEEVSKKEGCEVRSQNRRYLLQLQIGSFVGHPLMAHAQFPSRGLRRSRSSLIKAHFLCVHLSSDLDCTRW